MKNAALIVGLCLVATAGLQAQETWTDPVSGLEFVKVPPGCFAMGAERSGTPGPGWKIAIPGPDEVPRHKVCVDGFWFSRSEVTRGAYSKVTGVVQHVIDVPMVNVTWDDAVAFGRKLGEVSGASYRLPTEAEWEWACHAGAPSVAVQAEGEARFALLEETAKAAWYRYEMVRDPVGAYPVMRKSPNAWGLYDMLGNAWEWVADGYDQSAYARHAEKNPKQSPVDDRRVIRGGSYKTDIARVRCGARSYAPAEERTDLIGFRILRELDPPVSGVKK